MENFRNIFGANFGANFMDNFVNNFEGNFEDESGYNFEDNKWTISWTIFQAVIKV